VCFLLSSFDATRFGHVSSFLRHSCSGNLRPVLLHSASVHVPRVLLLADRAITRGEELSLAHDAQDCVAHSLLAPHHQARINLYCAAQLR
jgi:hypothetical protein